MNTDIFQHIPHAAFEAYARYKKAEQLAAALTEANIPPEAVPDLTPTQRHHLETTAGIRIASNTTWGIAVLILTQRNPHAHPTPRHPHRTTPTIADVHKAITTAAAAHGRQAKLF